MVGHLSRYVLLPGVACSGTSLPWRTGFIQLPERLSNMENSGKWTTDFAKLPNLFFGGAP